MKQIVKTRALIARINRKLAREDEALRTTRGDSRAFSNLGTYYIVDVRRNTIERMHVDLEEIAKEVGVLRTGEKVSD